MTFLIVAACIARILLRPNREPAARLAWLVVVVALPIGGVIAYVLIGETNIGRKRAARLKQIFDALPRPRNTLGWDRPEHAANLTDWTAPIFRVGTSICGYPPVGGNSGRLMKDSDTTIDEMVADVDAAKDHAHVNFYIWLADNNGKKMIEALKRAAKRGVTCRALVDDIGSRDLVRSSHWKEMESAGVKVARALKIGNPLLRIFNGRIDLRNHRKILVIDNRITYCGSQNCADPAFLPKAKYAPWVDAVMRFEGPVVRQNQHLFASDWMASYNEDISDMLNQPIENPRKGFTAQVVSTGPTDRASAMPEMFQSLMFAARRELCITTPYFAPNSPMLAALRAAANRGIDTTVIFPARNNDFAVGAASKSYYEDLLIAGVKIYEYQPGMLHTKSMTLDGQVTLIGSANMDRRSFDLNYENNILLHDSDLTADMQARQAEYLADSKVVLLKDVQSWNWQKKLWNNTMAILGPLI
ncbi:MAG: cardiolipin synthase [Paracoccaceae bacterium]